MENDKESSERGLLPSLLFLSCKRIDEVGCFRLQAFGDAKSSRIAVLEEGERTLSDGKDTASVLSLPSDSKAIPGEKPPTQPFYCFTSHSVLVIRQRSPRIVMTSQGWIWSIWLHQTEGEGASTS